MHAKRILMALLVPWIVATLAACARTVPAGHLDGLVSRQGLGYELYVPESYDGETELPLLLLLHGGGQTAAAIASLSRMDDYAELRDVVVVYPEQSVEANPGRYWNWFLPENQTRGEGEPEMLADLVREVSDAYRIDRDRIAVAGFSAGGCMAITLGILYPDLFDGIATTGAVAFGVANDAVSANEAIAGTLPAIDQTIDAAYAAMPAEFRRPVRALLFHGDADQRVDFVNLAFATDVLVGLNARIDQTFPIGFSETERIVGEGRLAFTVDIYHGDGAMIQVYAVEGMAHRWPGAPSSETYGDPLAPDFSELALAFLFPAS
ncbi:MAG: PHB depolymerase family esterase [Candidatus Izemoplasmatales bacterium]